uniref:Uncharacterized protein n=1 Tax=Arion vulgaris TaxID=1028688 RepID=A0A0B7B5C0_9EUPU
MSFQNKQTVHQWRQLFNAKVDWSSMSYASRGNGWDSSLMTVDGKRRSGCKMEIWRTMEKEEEETKYSRKFTVNIKTGKMFKDIVKIPQNTKLKIVIK